jgi:hypothetical protein
MTPVSHEPVNSAMGHGAHAVDYAQLKRDLADAMLLALNDDAWQSYNAALHAWFFAVAYRPVVPVVAYEC